MRPAVADKRQTFRDTPSHRLFRHPQSLGCRFCRNPAKPGVQGALASSSAGMAWSQARPDYNVARDDVLAHLAALCAATDIPVNADFENGFADDPEGVARNVALAIDTGVAGLSVEDSS